MTPTTARNILLLAASAAPASLLAQETPRDDHTPLRYAFVVHYDASQVRLNSGLFTSAAAPVWKRWSADRPLGTWRFQGIIDSGEQPAGTYAGFLRLDVPQAEVDRASATAKEFLAVMEKRLGQLLAQTPQELAGRRLDALRAELNEFEEHRAALRERLVTDGTVMVQNPEWVTANQKLKKTEIEVEEAAASLHLLEQQLQTQNEEGQRIEQDMQVLRAKYDKLTKIAATITQANPEWSVTELELATLSQEFARSTDQLSRSEAVMAELAVKQRNVAAQHTVLRERAKQLRELLETTARMVAETVQAVDPSVADEIEAVDRRIAVLLDETNGIERGLRQLTVPRITPWF